MIQLEKYRESVASKMATVWRWIQEIVLFVVAPSNPITWRDMWNQLLLRIIVLKSRLTVDSKEKKRLLEWVSTKIKQGKPPTDFNESWKNGIALCALVEGIVKGSCPRYDLLNPEHAQANLRLGLHLIEKNIKIKPGITMEEFMHFDAAIERKLVCLVSQLKLASAKLRLKSAIQKPAIFLNPVTTMTAEGECIAKGMGLMLAVKGRKARFHIYLKSLTLMNIVIEIRGPENTICSERITNRSPKKRTPSKLTENEGWRKIPLDYNILPGKITIGFTPLEVGNHRLSIIWQGQHIIGSPYTISVDEAARTVAADPKEIKRLIVPLKKAGSLEEFSNKESDGRKRYNSVSLGDIAKLGNVTKKRILRHFLTVDGKEVVIENSDEEPLAKAIMNLRSKSRFSNNGGDFLEVNNTENCNKNLAHRKKKSVILPNRDSGKPEPVIGKSDCNFDKSSSPATNGFNEFTCHIFADVKSQDNSNSLNFLQSRQDDLFLTSKKLSPKQKEEKSVSTIQFASSLPSDTQHSHLVLSDQPQRRSCTTEEDSLKDSPKDILCDFSQQADKSDNIPHNGENFLQQGECNYDSRTELKTTESAISTVSSALNSETDLKSSTEMSFDSGFGSKDGESTLASPDPKNYKNYGSSLVDIAISKNAFCLNEKSSQRQKYNESKGRCDLSIHDDSHTNEYLQETIQMLKHGDEKYSQGINCGRVTAQKANGNSINLPENNRIEKCDVMSSQRNDVLPYEFGNLPSDNDSIVEHGSQKQISVENTLIHHRDIEKTGPERNKHDFNLLKHSTATLIANYDQQDYPTEGKSKENNCIHTPEKELFVTMSEISIKEDVISDSEKNWTMEHGRRQIGVEYQKGGTDQNSDEHDFVRRHKTPNVNERKQHGTNNKAELETSQNDHRREGFLSRGIEKNFKLIESPNEMEANRSKTSEFRDVPSLLNEDNRIYDSYISIPSSDDKKLSDDDHSLDRDHKRYISQEFHSDTNSIVDTTFISENTKYALDVQEEPSRDNQCFCQSNFSSNGGDMGLHYSGVKLGKTSDRRKSHSNIVEDVGRIETLFDKNTRHVEELNSTSFSLCIQSAVKSNDCSNNIDNNQTIINKNLEGAVLDFENSTQETMQDRSPCRTLDNYDARELQHVMPKNLGHSSEIPETPNKQAVTSELNKLKEPKKTSLSSSLDNLCSSSQKDQVLYGSSSISMEFLSFALQQKGNSADQQSNSSPESKDDDEEEFPFAAMVQAKKEFWEKKLEEKACKQLPKVCCSSRKGCNNVNKLKTFWQHVAKGSEFPDGTEVNTSQSSPC